MNETLSQMHARRSIRRYHPKPIPDDLLDAVLKAAWFGPTSVNGQQVTVIVVKDEARRARIAEIAGGQPWIAQAPVFLALVMDFHKTAQGLAAVEAEQVFHEGLEGFTVGAVDCGIALGNLITAADAAGLGSVAIGGIRRDPAAMAALLELPPLTFPLVGLTLGYAAEEGAARPRLAFESFAHTETYQPAEIEAAIPPYNAAMQAHWAKIGRADGASWSASVSSFYTSLGYPEVLPTAKAQGFGFES